MTSTKENISEDTKTQCLRKKVKIYLSLSFFLSTLINSLLEIFREVFIITKQTPSSIHFIKLFLTFPLAFFFMILVQKALNKYRIASIYNFLTVSYILFFLAVGLFLLPNEEKIQKGKLWVMGCIDDGRLDIRGLKFIEAIIYIYGEWIYTVIYVLSEMWGSLMISYFFFTFANSVCTKSEMKEIFLYLSSTSAISMILSSVLFTFFNFIKQRVSYDASCSITSLTFVTIAFLTLAIYVLNNSIDKKKVTEEFPTKEIKSADSLWTLLESKVLRSVCLICLLYSFNLGIIEASFKNSLIDGSKRNDIPVDRYSSSFLSWTNIFIAISILLVNTLFYKKIREVGWLFASMVSPLLSSTSILLIAGLSFFNYPSATQTSLFFHDYLRDKPKFLNLENWLITVSIALIKMSKFVLLDMSKEVFAMRISETLRGKYKGVYDGMCVKLGKSLCALYGAFFTLFGIDDIRKMAPVTFALSILTAYVWIKSTLFVNRRYQESVVRNQEIEE